MEPNELSLKRSVTNRLFIVILLALITCFVHAQSDPKWKSISSVSGDFRISLPSDLIVFKKEDSVTLYAYFGGVSVKIENLDVDRPQSYLKKHSFTNETDKEANVEFSLGEFNLKTVEYDNGEVQSMYVYAASKNKYYAIVFKTPSRKALAESEMLKSLRIDGKYVSKSASHESRDGDSLIIEKLKSSPQVEVALKAKCSDNVRYGFADRDLPSETAAVTFYSRELVILNKSTLNLPGDDHGQGKVKLRVFFGTDGYVTGAIVMPGSDRDAVKRSVRAASCIKFLPAEIDGSPVEVIKTLQYEFTSR